MSPHDQAKILRWRTFLFDHRIWTTVGATLLIGAPAIIAVVSLLGQSWYPTGDVSHTELMLRSLPRHFPLVGVAARVGEDLNNQGSTPGASMAYLIYPIYFILGRSSAGMVISVLVLHITAMGASVYLAWRLGGARAAWALGIIFALVVRSLAPRFFLEPWNVWIPLFAFAVFLLLMWAVVLGRHQYLAFATAVGIHCVQTHVSYVPLIGGLLGLGVFLVLLRRWRNPQLKVLKPLGISAAIGLLMWIPPIIQQLRPGPGNLGRLWRHFSLPNEDTVGLSAAVRAMVGELNMAGPFLSGPGRAPYDPPHIWGFLAFVLIVGTGVVLAWRLRDRRMQSLQLVLGASTLIGLWATSRVFGHFYDYVIRWMWILALMWLAVSVWAIVESLRAVCIRRLLVVALTTGALVSVLWGAIASAGAHPPYKNDSRLVGGLAPLLQERIDPTQDYLLRWHDPAALGGTGFGLLLEMEKRDIQLFVDTWAGAAARPHRARLVENTDVVLCFVVGPENIDLFRTRENISELAYFDPRSSDEQEESNSLRQQIEEMMKGQGQPELISRMDSQYGHIQILLAEETSPELFVMLDRYSEIRLPGALFEAPQGSLCIP